MNSQPRRSPQAAAIPTWNDLLQKALFALGILALLYAALITSQPNDVSAFEDRSLIPALYRKRVMLAEKHQAIQLPGLRYVEPRS